MVGGALWFRVRWRRWKREQAASRIREHEMAEELRTFPAAPQSRYGGGRTR